MTITIDRFEGDYAVVELPDGNMSDMPKALLPPEAKEGDIIDISINADETDNRKKRIKGLMNNLWD